MGADLIERARDSAGTCLCDECALLRNLADALEQAQAEIAHLTKTQADVLDVNAELGEEIARDHHKAPDHGG